MMKTKTTLERSYQAKGITDKTDKWNATSTVASIKLSTGFFNFDHRYFVFVSFFKILFFSLSSAAHGWHSGHLSNFCSMNTLVLIWGLLDEHAGSNLANTRNSTPTNCVQLIFESQLLKKLTSSAQMFTPEENTLKRSSVQIPP